MRTVFRTIVALGVLLASMGAPLEGQDDSWQRKWYWGAQSGITTFGSGISAFTTGGHWLITGTQSALYVGLDALLFGIGSLGGINIPMANPDSPTGSTVVGLRRGNRVEFLLYAMPTKKRLQLYAGGGFAINQVTDAVPRDAAILGAAELNTALDLIDELDTKVFVVFSGGLQLRLGRLVAYGEYRYLPSSRDFLLNAPQHSLLGGFRYALTHANEQIETGR